MSMLSQFAVGCLLVIGLFLSGMGYGTHRANARHELLRLQAVEKARERETALQQQIEVNDEQHKTELDRIAAARDAALRRLRERPERVPAAATPACDGASGAQLSRPDAGFLTGEAARADQLRADLDACYGWVEAVRKAHTD
jgi:hypothetical protein